MQPKIGEIITVENIKYITELEVNPDRPCIECHLCHKPCWDIACTAYVRQDNQTVIFKEVKEMEIKIQIPDNCELIKDGDTYVVREKKQQPPRSWEEFCERYPVKKGEAYIDFDSRIENIGPNYGTDPRNSTLDKNLCVSKEEAEAFLALMQLRQLRKAWVGDWELPKGKPIAGLIYSVSEDQIRVVYDTSGANVPLSFPTPTTARDFLSCFNDLCEKAKILL